MKIAAMDNLGPRQDHGNGKGKPTNHLQQSLAMAWSKVLGRNVGVDENFFDLDGTSLDGLTVMAYASELVGKDLPAALLYTYPTIRELAAHMEGLSPALRWSNLVAVRAEGAAIPVVCVHGDEANYNLSRLLPSAHPFYAFFHQGEDGGELQYRTFPDIAEHYARELQQARPAGPVVICGYSYGGIIAMELAKRLTEQGREVPLLVILDSRSPGYIPPVTLKSVLLRIRDARDRMRCRAIFQNGERLPEELRNFNIMDTYGQAMRKYRTGPWPGHTLLVRSAAREKETRGWNRVLPDLRTVVVPGDHRSIITASGIPPVVEAIQARMAELSLGT